SDQCEGPPGEPEEEGAARPLPVTVDQLAPPAPAEIPAAGREHHDVGNPDERHERQATREGYRRHQDHREQRRGRDPYECTSPKRAVHLVGAGLAHLDTERTLIHLAKS